MELKHNTENYAEMIEHNLKGYPHIAECLGRIIKQRLGIECFTHGALTANLLENDGTTPLDLTRLDTVLQFGKGCCKNFDAIFSEDSLSLYQDADAKILDLLAEVKAFEFLCAYGFRDITKETRTSEARTVDFIASRGEQTYAVEVTRLGIMQSDRKQPVFDEQISTLTYADCEDADGLEISIISNQGINTDRLEEEIYDASNTKYDQMRDFCLTKTGNWKGLLFLSSGRDYFVAGRFENQNFEITPKRDFLEALGRVRRCLINEDRVNYLHYWVITRGKDLQKAIVFPNEM